MADIPSISNYIQIEETDFESPTAENMFQRVGGSVNFLLDKSSENKIERYTSPGGFNYVVPAGADMVYCYVMGGGGGGAGVDNRRNGSAGGGGSYHNVGFFPVTGGQNLAVTIGAGGVGGGGNTVGGTGGNTTIVGTGVSLQSRGSTGGEKAQDDNPADGANAVSQTSTGGGNGGAAIFSVPNYTALSGSAGFRSDGANGGSGGSPVDSGTANGRSGGGGGGASSLAAGGSGGNGAQAGQAGTGFGAGGGGAGGDLGGGGFLNGGSGGGGTAVIIAYKLG